MHRSGTSATTGALRCLGVQLGTRLYEGHADINTKGYFEHSEIADANEEALWTLGSSWDDIVLKEAGWWRCDELRRYRRKILKCIQRDFSRSPLWAVKDPRVCRMLPWWLDILSEAGVEPRFLVMVRPAAAVYQSLARRDGFSRDKAYLLWTLHYLEAERWSRGYPRTFLAFDRFLQDPTGEVRRVARELGLTFPTPPDAARECLKGFLSQDLRHHADTVEAKEDSSELLALTVDLELALIRVANGEVPTLDATAMDDLQRRMDTLQRSLPSELLTEHLRSTANDRGSTRLVFARCYRSWSWHAGKPIRFLERLLGRDV